MSWLTLGLVGGAVGIDATSFPQVMFSRPVIAATITGLLFGQPTTGLLIGAVLEIFALVILPFGAARYPESGTAAAAAAGAYAMQLPVIEPPLLLAIAAFALVWEQVAGATVIAFRRFNERLVARLAEHPRPARAVVTSHAIALTLDFVRAAVVVVVGAWLGMHFLQFARAHLRLDSDWSSTIVMMALLAMLGSTLPLFGGLRQRRFSYALGLLCGLLLLG